MRTPDLVLSRDDGRIYLNRWHLLPRNRFLNLYLHQFLGSDDDRALHDHPWWFVSWIIKGEYIEHTPTRYQQQLGVTWTRIHSRTRWSVAYRPAKWAHRVQLLPDGVGGEKPVWTIILTGPKIRSWGFYCPQGWVHWWRFDRRNGCGEQ